MQQEEKREGEIRNKLSFPTEPAVYTRVPLTVMNKIYNQEKKKKKKGHIIVDCFPSFKLSK